MNLFSSNGNSSPETEANILLTQQLKRIFGPKIATVPETAYRQPNSLNLQWQNQLAIQRVYQLTQLFGRSPDCILTQAGGCVNWVKVPAKSGSGYYTEIKIWDKNIVHFKPVPHSDFMHVTIKMPLKARTIPLLAELTTSVAYYPEGGELTAACGEMGANIITFAVVKMLDQDLINLAYARVVYDQLILHFLKEEFMPAEKNQDMWRQPMPLRDACEAYVMNQVGQEEQLTQRIKQQLGLGQRVSLPSPRAQLSRPLVSLPSTTSPGVRPFISSPSVILQ